MTKVSPIRRRERNTYVQRKKALTQSVFGDYPAVEQIYYPESNRSLRALGLTRLAAELLSTGTALTLGILGKGRGRRKEREKSVVRHRISK